MSENTPNSNSSGSSGQPQDPQFIPAAPPAAPTANAYNGYVPTKLPAGLAITSLVLGIVGLVAGIIPVVSFAAVLIAIVALILGILALRKVSKGTGGGKGMAIGGVVVGAIALLVSAVVSIFTIIGFMVLQQCNETGVRHSDGTVTCNVSGSTMTIYPDGSARTQE